MPDALPRHPKGDACRLCLVSREEMESIFCDPELVLTITETVRLEIYEGDGLPAQICQPCIGQLNTASRFIQRCHMSDAQLRLPLLKGCASTGALEVTASAHMETATTEPILEGNWACSLTPIKTELREELDIPPLNTGDFSVVNLKSEVLEHPLEGADPLEEFSHELTEPADETNWDVNSVSAPNFLEWKTSSPTNNSGWQDNSLQTPGSSWQTSHKEVWQDQSLQPSSGMGWASSSLQPYNSMMWQHSTQESNSTKCHRVDLERKTKEAMSPSEINTSFNCIGDGVLIEPSSDVPAMHQNTPLNTETYSLNYLSGFQNVTENQPLFTCYLCPKSFTTNRALSCHINMGHKQKNPHKGDSFQRSPSMPEKSRLWCSLCSTSFLQREELVKHLNTHQGHSSYYCSRCDKGFQSQQALKVHTKTHAKEKRYKCTKCEKSFSLRSYFRVHELTHKKN